MILPDALRSRLLDETRAAYPNECCGLLEGEGERITTLHPARNLSCAPDRFEIDPALQFRLKREGRSIIGCYHSHPDGAAEPSPRDVEGASEAGFVWLIAGREEIGAFMWDGRAFQRMGLEGSAAHHARPAIRAP